MKKNKIKFSLNYNDLGFTQAPTRGAGFTILEIIVSMSLFIFVILLSGSLFTFSQKAYNKGSERGELTQNIRVALDRMTRELRQAVDVITTLPIVDDNPLDPPAEEIFFQDGHDISQTTYLRYYLDNSDLKRDWLAYYFSGDPNTYILYNSIDQYGNSPTELVLSSRVVGEYFSKLNFWGTANLIHIYAELVKDSSRLSISSSVLSRN